MNPSSTRSTLSPDEPPLDPAKNSADEALLKKIQGNILNAHGRDFVRLVLFRFNNEGPSLRDFFPAALQAKLVTTAWKQWDDARHLAQNLGNEPFYGLGISQPGMVRCGYGPDDLPGSLDAGFQTPMTNAAEFKVLGDAPAGPGANAGPDWEQPYRDEPHGVWLIAHNQPAQLDGMERTVREFLRGFSARVLTVERGMRWKDAVEPKRQREPFGFFDGISQPEFFAGPDYDKTPKWVRLPRAQVLLPELNEQDHPGQSQHAFGSFLVLRKLEQNVAAFLEFEDKLKPQLTGAASCPFDPGALLIGRSRDGVPLAPVSSPARPNDFDFGTDVSRCPFHAHIRKSNPRINGDVPPFTDEFVREQLFPRRGAVYDDNNPPRLPEKSSAHYAAGPSLGKDGQPSKVGLLFMAYMSSLAQFGALQKNWFSNPSFPVDGTNFGDAALRPNDASEPGATPFDWQWQGARMKAPLAQFVRPRGGAYFYVPPIAWLAAQRAPALLGAGSQRQPTRHG